MRKKSKGFTILELIIALSLTVVVLGVVYTFFLVSSKTITKTQINSDIQIELEAIQKELLFYGTQAEKISKIEDISGSNLLSKPYNDFPSDGKLEIKEVKFKIDSEQYAFIYEQSFNTLTLKKFTSEVSTKGIDIDSEFEKVLSKNIKNFEIRPLDYQINKSNGKLENATGLEISLILNKKKGYSDVTIPLSVIVKFRNK